MLTRIHQRLDDGGTLLIVEPKPSLRKQSALRHWIQRVVKSACLNDSPASEFDIALFAELQKRLFLSSEVELNSAAELVALAGKAGFAVTLVRDVLHGHFSALLLRKVPKPKFEIDPVIRYHDDPYTRSPPLQ